jgi:hypothetical protein
MPVEWWIIFATLAGPVLAVQTQKFIERATERRNSRRRIFTVLMANRATRLNDDFVTALNLIDLEFGPGPWRASRADKEVINAWRTLFGELSAGPAPDAVEAVHVASSLRRDDCLVDLLLAMSKALGYSFTSEELRRGIYHPQGSANREQAVLSILDGLKRVLAGEASLPMAVTHFPGDPALVAAQADLARKAASAYDETSGALKVKQVA